MKKKQNTKPTKPSFSFHEICGDLFFSAICEVFCSQCQLPKAKTPSSLSEDGLHNEDDPG